MNFEEIEKVINQKLKELHKIKDYYENLQLMDENQYLKIENERLKKRNKELETNKVQPFTINSFDPEIQLHDLEKQYILNAVKFYKNDKSKAAEALGLTIKTLYNKLYMYGEI